MRQLIFSAVFLVSVCAVRAQTLLALTETGTRSARLNIVMLSEGYTASELSSGKFRTDATTISNALLTTEPFKSYRPFFNVYGIAIASNESGADQGSLGTTRDTYFNATFNTGGVDRLLTIDSTGHSRAVALLNTFVPEYDLVLVIVNDSKYGGSGGSIAVTSTNASAPEIAIHEIGHSFAGLGDEYDYAGSTPRETPNTTQQTQRSLIKWNQWINTSTPVPTPENSPYDFGVVGLFEGAAYRPTGWYRPTLDSKMQTLGEPFYAVNEEAIVLSIYNRVSPITSASPATASVSVSLPNQTLTFTVDGPSTALTAPALTIEWRLDGAVIAGQKARTLTRLSNTIGNGTHTLLATVTDPTTKVRKDTAGLLSDTHSWTLNLTNQGPAAPTNLIATAKPDGGIDLTWTDNASDEGGFAIDRAIGTGAFTELGRVGIDATSYTDTSATAGTATKYRVKGINAADSAVFGAASTVVTVTPEVAPAPVSDPASLAVLGGQPATFTVQATGVPLRYQWRRNSTNITGATKATYTITSAQFAHAGSYDCVVSNDVGSYTSGVATLTVNVKPTITQHPLSASLLYGQPVTLSVQATGTAALMFQWRKNNIDLPGETNSTLSIASPDVTHSGSYTCLVSNAFGNATTKAAVLTVLGPPVVTQQPSSTTIARGTSAIFNVTATGTPALTYQWRKNGTIITGATTARLTLSAAKDSDAASYDCVASNSYGRTTSNAATLGFTVTPTTDFKAAGARAGAAKWKWAKRFGGTDTDTVLSLYAEPDDNHLLFGGHSRSIGIKLDALPASNLGAYVARLQSDGKAAGIRALSTATTSPAGALWLGRPLPGTFAMDYLAITRSSLSPTVMTQGQFTGTPPSGPQQSANDYTNITGFCAATNLAESYFIGGSAVASPNVAMIERASLTSVHLGGINWTRSITGNGSGTVLAMERLVSGDIVAAGKAAFDSSGNLTFENSVGSPATIASGTPGKAAGFVVRYSDTGDLRWGTVTASELRSLSVETNGAIWCAGTDENSGLKAVAVRLSPIDGATELQIPIPNTRGLSVATCSGGDVAVLLETTGDLYSPCIIEGYRESHVGTTVMKFSHTGTLQWALPMTGIISGHEHKLVASGNGALYVAVTCIYRSLAPDSTVDFSGLAKFAMTGRDADAFVASISELPSVIEPPASQIIPLGQALHLSVNASNLSGSIGYQWLKDGKVLTGKTASALDIASTKLTDAGSYTCKVTGNGGTVESAKAIVNIVDTTPRTVKSPLTKPLDLPVSASGTGLSFTWWKNGARVFNTGGFTNTTTSRLHIAAMSTLFADNYVCKVTGPGGTLDAPFVADVLHAPVFTAPTVPASIVSGAFDLQLSATDAATFKITNLPAGLVYNAATGRITGKPTLAGSKLVSVIASNAAGPSATLSFIITVIDLPAHLEGTHQGLLSGERPWLNDLDGLLTLTVSATGAVTGSLRTTAGIFTHTGRVDADPAAQTWSFRQRIARTGKPALVLAVNSADAMTHLFTGSLIEEPTPGDVASINGHRNVWSIANPGTASAGTFNATLQASGSAPLTPGALKTIVTATTGVCVWSGKLGDNTAIAGSTYLSPSIGVPVWQALYVNHGQVIGSTNITSPTINGTLQWKRKQVGTGVFWNDSATTVTGTKAP